MIEDIILRGDIRLCDFGEAQGYTAAKKRPVVVIQNNIANRKSQTIIVVIIRTNPRVGKLPVGVKIELGPTGLKKTSYVDLGHIYTVNKTDIREKIGSVSKSDILRINIAKEISLGQRDYP